MNYWQRLDWNDKAPLEDKIKAVYNILNFVSREMSAGRVPQNKEELKQEIVSSEARVTTPLSIAFVKMAEKGDIDEVTASEHVDMFLPWGQNIDFNMGDLRTYPVKMTGLIDGEEREYEELRLFKCLQAHTSQEGWTPTTSPSLWKMVGIAENGIPEWSQPISTSDAYMTGDEVMYNGVHYRSIIDNNVWSPDIYPQGWEVVVE